MAQLLVFGVVGAVAAADSAAVGGSLADIGVSDDLIRDCGETLQPGRAAVFYPARKPPSAGPSKRPVRLTRR